MCCWHSLWLHCVSSKAVRHSLVTQRELLISQERDVLTSASGSFADKQLASLVNGVVMASATKRRTLRSLKGAIATYRISIHYPPPPPLPPGSSLRSVHRAEVVHRFSLCGASPTCEPCDTGAHSGRGGENSHVMQ